MRRVLNLLQTAHMAYPEVDEQAVYLTAGAAVPAVVDGMFAALLNEPFTRAYSTILQVTPPVLISLTSTRPNQ